MLAQHFVGKLEISALQNLTKYASCSSTAPVLTARKFKNNSEFERKLGEVGGGGGGVRILRFFETFVDRLCWRKGLPDLVVEEEAESLENLIRLL